VAALQPLVVGGEFLLPWSSCGCLAIALLCRCGQGERHGTAGGSPLQIQVVLGVRARSPWTPRHLPPLRRLRELPPGVASWWMPVIMFRAVLPSSPHLLQKNGSLSPVADPGIGWTESNHHPHLHSSAAQCRPTSSVGALTVFVWTISR
jgi:hypothetical protein